MHPFAAFTGLRHGRTPRAAGTLWLLALMLLMQWSVPGLAQAPERRGGQSEAPARLATPSVAKLRDVGKLAGTELRAKDGKQQTAPAGGDPALAAAFGPSLCAMARASLAHAAEQVAPGRIARLAFEARAPPAA
jgi:hypothetical protein